MTLAAADVISVPSVGTGLSYYNPIADKEALIKMVEVIWTYQELLCACNKTKHIKPICSSTTDREYRRE